MFSIYNFRQQIINSGSGLDRMDSDTVFKLAAVALVLSGVLVVGLVIMTVVLSYCIYCFRKKVEVKILSKLFDCPMLAMRIVS